MKNLNSRTFDLFSNKKNELATPYIIAEAGVNHEGSMENALRMIDQAKEGGADAIKFQTYKANTLAVRESPAYWDISKEKITSQYDLFSKHDKFWKKEMERLKIYSDKTGIEFLSTPFDFESANFLNDLMPIFKISSSDITNKPFIEYISNFKKPIILSTGASDLWEIQEAVSWIAPKNIELLLMHCVLNYPTADNNANLGMITGLRRAFPDLKIGYSDHTMPSAEMTTCVTAAILGSVVIEKHFTFDKRLEGNDHYHSMDLQDLKNLVKNLRFVREIIGGNEVKSLPEESLAKKNARRSLVSKKNIPAGKIINEDDLIFKRPASGISPKYIGEVLGKTARVSIKEDDIIKWSMLE